MCRGITFNSCFKDLQEHNFILDCQVKEFQLPWHIYSCLYYLNCLQIPACSYPSLSNMTGLLRCSLLLPISAPSPSYNGTKNFPSSLSLQCEYLFFCPCKITLVQVVSSISLIAIFDMCRKIKGWDFPQYAILLCLHHTLQEGGREGWKEGGEGGREGEQTICARFSQTEGWASNARVRLNQRRGLQAPKEGEKPTSKGDVHTAAPSVAWSYPASQKLDFSLC